LLYKQILQSQTMHSTDMSSEIRKNLSENLPIEEKSRLIIFMVKKYKCIIIWLFSVASIAEFIYLILEKNSEGKFLEIAQKYLNATRAIDIF